MTDKRGNAKERDEKQMENLRSLQVNLGVAGEMERARSNLNWERSRSSDFGHKPLSDDPEEMTEKRGNTKERERIQ